LGVYQAEKRMGKTNKGFEEWMMDHLYPVRGEDGSIIYLKDMAVRNIILSSIGIKPSLRDLLMPADSFAKKYITEGFNPSMNIYFSFPIEPDSRKAYGEHLIMEGFAYRLVGEKGKDMMDKGKMWNLLMKEYKKSYSENYGIYTGPPQSKVLTNHAFLYFLFGDKALSDLLLEIKGGEISLVEKDTLSLLENLFKRAFIFSQRPELSLAISSDLKKVYSMLNGGGKGVAFSDSLLSIKDTPVFHLFRGEMLTLTIQKEGMESRRRFLEAEKEFKDLLLSKEIEPFAYKGLIDLYFSSNQQEKLEEIVSKVADKPKVAARVLYLTMRFDTEEAIYLLENWKKRFPNDPNINRMLIKLKESVNKHTSK
ncbi:MAG: hypothetical protein U9N06_02510, partial [candidate division WOR-3 bacterium]|nr:hypothetical protein [candidate division WOR-3 bacterium]